MAPVPADASDERRAQRRLGQELLDEVAADLAALPGSSRRRMFGCEGLFTAGRVVAFVDGDGALVVKLPPDRASDLVAEGTATRVRMGRSPAREWVAVPRAGAADELRPLWAELVRASYDHVSSGAPRPS
ncbi:TfoX/Sxy family protein [Quadrisphaera setariae]|uniref:TfoX/Sxy family protein n=1 Tax=Quadrisphaera setariae TaxID=2593304 RepID=A0A5C8ZHA3_9ACTN|nr:TfoX/Sxy family protein [Quadrisphaera setariae]